MRFSKIIFLGLFIISSNSVLAASYNSGYKSYYSEQSQSTLKFSLTAFQLFSLEGAERPLSLSGFVGSSIVDFGDIGLYIQSTFPTSQLGSITHGGLKLAPKILEKNWGGLYWANKIGYGNYRAQGALIVGTGLLFETGSLLHIYADFIHNIPISKGQELYSNTFGLGLGMRLQE